jgi:UDPglucose--hexose-1-phosphate uridylyltransferase
MASEIRQNKATKQWVIYSPAREKRPNDFQKSGEKLSLPERDEGCPFCPGNEHTLPPIIIELKGQQSWQVRVVPNKFPALTPDGNLVRYQKGIYVTMQGYGHHEVIIESPLHNQQMGQMTVKEVQLVIEAYYRRYTDLIKKNENMMIIIFRNNGLRAGTSLVHPHSQLIATGMVPNYIRWREEESQRYFDEWGRCVYCDILDYEMEDRRRVIYENKSFVAFIPFAAEVPFEVWIMSRKHKADFGDISEIEKSNLAAALHDILGKMYRNLNDPDYNYVINTSARYMAKEPRLHWYLQIRPRLMTTAGFEIGSGISINPSLPEDNADFLKEG